MSLLDDAVFAHACVKLISARIESSEGGWQTVWKDGNTFTNHQALDTSTEAKRAEQEGVTSLYAGLIGRDVDLNYGDYFRDETLNETYRVTSIPAEKQAPECSFLSLKYFTAERKVPPT